MSPEDQVRNFCLTCNIELYNLINIFSGVTGHNTFDIEEKYAGSQKYKFKMDLSDALSEEIGPIREKYNQLLKDRSYLDEVLAQGAKAANERAEKTMNKIRKGLKLMPRKGQ